MFKNNDAPSMPDYEAYYNKTLKEYEAKKAENNELIAKNHMLTIENMKYKTVIATMEFALGRKLNI